MFEAQPSLLFSRFFRNLMPFMSKEGVLVLCFPYFTDNFNMEYHLLAAFWILGIGSRQTLQ
jgi:hypothetical protein